MRIGKGQQEIHLVQIQQYNLDTATFRGDGDDITLSSKPTRQAPGSVIASEPFVIHVEVTPHSDETEKYKPLQVFRMKTKWNDPRVAPYSPTG